jgi:hypothetical protein
MNQAERQKVTYARNRARILKLLQWDDLTYTTYQYEQGLVYMKDVLRMHDWAIAYMETSSLFWRWWRNQWDMLDNQLFIENVDRIPYGNMLDTYTAIHTPKFLKAHPGRAVMQESFKHPLKEELPL